MTKIWKIIKYEYTRHVFKKRFIFNLLSLPIVVILLVGVAMLIASFTVNTKPVGYIDHSGVLDQPIRQENKGDMFNPIIDFQSYTYEEQAQASLDEDLIQAFYVIPEAFPESRDVQLIFLEEPSGNTQNQFDRFVRQNLETFQTLEPQIKTRLDQGSIVTMASQDGSREMREDQWYLTFTPFIAGIMFIIVVMTSGGYLLQAVVEEKENRTMEIMISSVNPGQLMTGKIIGNIAVGLTQLIIWLIFGWIGLTVGGQFWPLLRDFTLPPNYILVLLLVLLPSFVMVAAIMAAIGATMTEAREAQQLSGMFSLPIMIPYYISSSIMMNPNSPLAVGLSYFPLTAPITILMRMSFTVVPAWQIALNIAILIGFAILAIWFAGRAFRLGMLRYGKKLSFREVLRKHVEK
ncbi:MAG: ABC transporter permease [Chloroflexota bacterium]|nr:ABC transporter permease [Chloroflexota bacterium]